MNVEICLGDVINWVIRRKDIEYIIRGGWEFIYRNVGIGDFWPINKRVNGKVR